MFCLSVLDSVLKVYIASAWVILELFKFWNLETWWKLEILPTKSFQILYEIVIFTHFFVQKYYLSFDTVFYDATQTKSPVLSEGVSREKWYRFIVKSPKNYFRVQRVWANLALPMCWWAETRTMTARALTVVALRSTASITEKVLSRRRLVKTRAIFSVSDCLGAS